MSRPPRALAAVLFLALAVAVAAGCDPSPSTVQPRRAILILLDAARADRFSADGYSRVTTPNMDSLAREGLIFTKHFTQGVNTRIALPTLLYSRYFSRPLFASSQRVPFSDPADLFRAPDDEAISLPAAFSRAGIQTAIISAHPWLTPQTAFAGEFSEIHDLERVEAWARARGGDSEPNSVDGHVYHYPRAEVMIDYAIDWIDANPDGEFFLYLHLMDTHTPHFLDEDAQHFLGSAGLEGLDVEGVRLEGHGPGHLDRPLSKAERSYLDALYDGSLRYTDRHVGRLIDHLKAAGSLEHTAIGVTSDHGENLLEVPGRFGHTGQWNDLVARVPFLLYYPPKLSGGRVDFVSEGVDIMPTLLGLFDLSLPDGKRTDGVDLADVLEGRSEPGKHAYIRNGIRGERFKCVFENEKDVLLPDAAPQANAVIGQLYDIRADPLETSNLWSEQTENASKCIAAHRSKMRKLYRRYDESRTSSQPPLAFAISSNHFSTHPPVPRADPDEVFSLLKTDSLTGWHRILNWTDFYIAAGSGSPPMKIDFPVPNGRYRLSAAILGSGVFTFEDDQAGIAVSGPRFEQEDWTEESLTTNELDWQDPVDVAIVDIRDEALRVTIEPDSSGSPFLLRQFGFEPIVAGDSPRPEEDEALLERLRGLGYVQ